MFFVAWGLREYILAKLICCEETIREVIMVRKNSLKIIF